MRRLALLGGGDWADASVDLLEIPDDTDLDAAKVAWRKWYHDIYVPALNDRNGSAVYEEFADFLKQRYGAVAASDIETFSDDYY